MPEPTKTEPTISLREAWGTTNIEPQQRFLVDVVNEYGKARAKYQPFHSAHEGYAVLLEEVDELWEWVRARSSNRSHEAMWQECIQIAAMAMAFATEVRNADGEQS